MRTTLDIDDRVLDVARAIVREKRGSVGAVVSELALKGLTIRSTTQGKSGFPTFSVPPEARPVTLEMVNEARDGG